MNRKASAIAVTVSLFLLQACRSSSDQSMAESGAGVTGEPGVIVPVASCEAMLDVDLVAIGGEGSRVNQAQHHEQDGFPVCEIRGTLAPSIGFRATLPLKSWRQRYLQVGCGGLCGEISLDIPVALGCLPVSRGDFVIASSDMGHQGRGGEFGKDPQKRVDFAYRGMHETAVATKAIIAAFYGQAPAYSYFSGCSDGGREALIEAQRFPDDFDGIVAGAPAMNFSVQNSFYHAWQARSNTDRYGEPILLAEHLPILNNAVLAQCDALDGLEDGLIVDPRACKFEPETVRCPAETSGDGCLSPEEVEAAKKLYGGPHDPKTRLPLTLGGPQPGSELSWAGVFVPQPGESRIFSRVIAHEALSNLVYLENRASPSAIDQLEFDAAAFDEIRPLHGLYGATDPDLAAFKAAGGKLILWHGWSDPHISPINTIAYYEALDAIFGTGKVQSFARLFLFPGMYHCRGGSGPSEIDLLTAIMQWVETNRAPESVIARSASSARPVFPYPAVARYAGRGPVAEASSFEPALGELGPSGYDWLGKDFFLPDRQLDCSARAGTLMCVHESTRQ